MTFDHTLGHTRALGGEPGNEPMVVELEILLTFCSVASTHAASYKLTLQHNTEEGKGHHHTLSQAHTGKEHHHTLSQAHTGMTLRANHYCCNVIEIVDN